MATYETGTIATDLAALKTTFEGFIAAMDGVIDLGGSMYSVNMETAERVREDRPTNDLSKYDRMYLSVGNNGAALRLTIQAGTGGDSTFDECSGATGSTWYFVSDGDDSQAPTYFFVYVIDSGVTTLEDFCGIGLGIRCLNGFQETVGVADVKEDGTIILASTANEVPSPWEDELNRKGSLNLAMVGSGVDATAEIFPVEEIILGNTPPLIIPQSLSEDIFQNYEEGSVLGKMPTNQFRISKTNGVILLYNNDASHNSGGTSSPVVLCTAGTADLGTSPTATIEGFTGFPDGAGYLIDSGSYVTYGLPGLYEVAGFGNNMYQLGEVCYAVSPDSQFKQQCMYISDFISGKNGMVAIGNWETI